ncbi:MAG TPA: hypothetical protein VGE74_24930 [Gemmata sp.]
MTKPNESDLPCVNWRQAETLQALHEGRTANSIRTERRDRTDTFYSHTRALRKRGLISEGKQGQKGSIKALVKPRGYLIKGETPLDDAWFTSTVIELAKQALTDETVCPILADALQDAGCDDRNVLELLKQESHEGATAHAEPGQQAGTTAPRGDFLRRRTRLLQRIVN